MWLTGIDLAQRSCTKKRLNYNSIKIKDLKHASKTQTTNVSLSKTNRVAMIRKWKWSMFQQSKQNLAKSKLKKTPKSFRKRSRSLTRINKEFKPMNQIAPHHRLLPLLHLHHPVQVQVSLPRLRKKEKFDLNFVFAIKFKCHIPIQKKNYLKLRSSKKYRNSDKISSQQKIISNWKNQPTNLPNSWVLLPPILIEK